MKYSLHILCLAICVAFYACTKLSSHPVSLTIIDDETGKPLAGISVILRYEKAFTQSSYDTKWDALGISDAYGKFNSQLSDDYRAINETTKDPVLLVYSDILHYSIKHIPLDNKGTKVTVRLRRTAEIEITYKKSTQASVIDSMNIGVNTILEARDYYFDDRYFFMHNLGYSEFYKPNTIDKDTTLVISCDPMNTYQFYYRAANKTIFEPCNLKRGDIKKVTVLY
jgi:hypothetical protein